MTPIFRRMHGRGSGWSGGRRYEVLYGFLFSIRCQFKAEGLSQVASSFVRRELMDGTPQVQHVAGGSTRRMEALEDIFAQVHRERAPFRALRAMHRARPATLGSVSSQTIEVAQVAQYAFHADLAAEVGEVD